MALARETVNAHVVCDVLLSYLEELPEPLIPLGKREERDREMI